MVLRVPAAQQEMARWEDGLFSVYLLTYLRPGLFIRRR